MTQQPNTNPHTQREQQHTNDSTGADLISDSRVCGVRQNSYLKQVKLGTLEYSGENHVTVV